MIPKHHLLIATTIGYHRNVNGLLAEELIFVSVRGTVICNRLLSYGEAGFKHAMRCDIWKIGTLSMFLSFYSGYDIVNQVLQGK
jgi:hypothetical protein